MITGGDVLEMLCPAGGWIIYGNDFDSVIWVDDRPRCSKEQFEAGFAQVDVWRAQQKEEAEAKRLATKTKLEALGLDEDDLKALGL